MSAEQELRQRRDALAQAVNSHDLETVCSFIDSSYVGKSKRGASTSYHDVVRLAEGVFAPGSDFQETVEIENIETDGKTGRVRVRRNQEMTGWLWIKQQSTTRALETWQMIDGDWKLTEEREL